jgi:hypothetical protein
MIGRIIVWLACAVLWALPVHGQDALGTGIVQTPQGRFIGTSPGNPNPGNGVRIIHTPQGRAIVSENPALPPAGDALSGTPAPVLYIGPRQEQPKPYSLYPEDGGLELAPGAPDTYTVVPGDTLWGLAARFLRQPHRWPDLWRMNAQEIKNPHRIVPGMVLALDRTAPGGPRLSVVGQRTPGTPGGTPAHFANRLEPRIYVDSSAQEAIAAIPQSVIEPFLTKPFLVDPKKVRGLARIVAFQAEHLHVGPGDLVYVQGLPDNQRDWQIVRPDKPLPDPDRSGRTLGLVVRYIGPAELIRTGPTATLRVGAAHEEVNIGDLLVPASRRELLAYVPRAPAVPINARVIDLYGGIGEGGQYSVVSLSRGGADGLERGHVLSLRRVGEALAPVGRDARRLKIPLPEEEYGTLFVFRVFERAAYALVMQTTRSVYPGDVVRNP